ncbi:T-cell receptor gamma alternate reading frame protein isoform X1 [Aotus nancymaae]|uniref:T-cell receptor gamma alternate reading frame protein isoform X1 n=1 Tax=Aotus nancymaae TaxID=37293 RepID=UPI0030FE54F6
MSLLEAFALSSFWALGLGLSKVEQFQLSISTEIKKSIDIPCKISSTNFETDVIHWYRQKPNQALEHLIYVALTKSSAGGSMGERSNKLEARKNSQTSTSILTIKSIEKEDMAIYYCAAWEYSTGWIKVFAEGTKLIVTPPDEYLGADISPKPTIFLPSIAETNLHKAGTYLCLLEKFFPDVINIHWQEKNSNTILESQEGNTMKTNDTYMKFSWLTVPEKSLHKEHRCIVRHENNKKGVDQEIIFPPVKTDVISMDPKDSCSKDANDALLLQLTNTSAYYTYLLLLLKSVVYFAIITFSLLRGTAACCNGERS